MHITWVQVNYFWFEDLRWDAYYYWKHYWRIFYWYNPETVYLFLQYYRKNDLNCACLDGLRLKVMYIYYFTTNAYISDIIWPCKIWTISFPPKRRMNNVYCLVIVYLVLTSHWMLPNSVLVSGVFQDTWAMPLWILNFEICKSGLTEQGKGQLWICKEGAQKIILCLFKLVP